ncbi:MAG TPA: twin-arginine translocation signal domain-containing protein, partial [Anaeromyxobacteraceae bacterium]|nr:twin-arginine translocation signal domain-containing protein [Anaeromyxobacteraceae bacterium]
MAHKKQLSRRDVMKYGAAAGAAGMFGKAFAQTTCVEPGPVDIANVTFTGCGIGELFPVSPFITTPFIDALPVPAALRPGYRRPDGTLAPANATDLWSVRQKDGVFGANRSAPGPGTGAQDSMGDRPANDSLALGLPRKGTHQLYPGGLGVSYKNLAGGAKTVFDALPAQPILYHIRLQLAQHRVTNAPVQNINLAGQTVALPPGANAVVANRRNNTFFLPFSTRYNFNGSFPGPLINAEYGKPVIVRFENDLDQNPLCLDRQDFGAPDWAFLTHLHNGHTAPESDGNPNHMTDNEGGYQPGQWVDNLYLGYPAGGDDREKQSFLWFHDHRMHHTGPNVYKGMVGLMPHYDPVLDPGDETKGLRLPGVRTNNPDGTFDVKYDVPLALYDACMDDGITAHIDEHQPAAVCGLTHPEWWGKLFLQHYPNHGFVGDIFTVNGVAFPVLNVERRKYRFRFLGASLARCYNMSLRQGTLVEARGRQGQWSFGVVRRGVVGFNLGTQVMKMTQIANEGGLLPTAFETDTVQVWPAKRREVIVDFSKYQDGTPTRTGDVIYLTNTMEMLNGRKPDNQFGFAVPMLKFV